MIINYIIRFDEVFIRFGCVNKKVELGFANNKMIVDLFCLVFKFVKGDVVFTKDVQIAMS